MSKVTTFDPGVLNMVKQDIDKFIGEKLTADNMIRLLSKAHQRLYEISRDEEVHECLGRLPDIRWYEGINLFTTGEILARSRRAELTPDLPFEEPA